MRGRSYSRSPPRGYGRRGRSPSPPRGGRYGGGGGGGRGSARDLPSSLLVRNLRHDCRPEDLRRPFGQFGALKDVYLPKDYYTGEPRGFGFVQFVDPADAAEAKYQMDGQIFLGRELTVVFAEENRKKPVEMRHRERGSGRGRYPDRGGDRRRSPPPRYSRSPPRYVRSRSRGRDNYSPPKRRDYSRSVSPQDRRHSRERYSHHGHGRSYSRSPPRNASRSRSESPGRGQSPVRAQSQSPLRSRSPSRSRSRSRSPGPEPEVYSREQNGDRSPSQ